MDYLKQNSIIYQPKLDVNDIIDEILDRGADILYMKYVMAKLPQFLGELYSGVSDYVIDEVALTFDKGDSQKDLRKFWNCDEEPGAAKIDTWARYRMETNIKEHKPEDKILQENTEALNKGSRAKDQKASMGKSGNLKVSTLKSAIRPQTTKVGIKGRGLDTSSKIGKSNISKLQKSTDEYEKIDDLEFDVALVLMPEDPKKKIVTSEIEEGLRHKRLEKDAKHTYDQMKRKEQEEADQLAQKKKLEFQKNLAKKQYTFDKNGDIIELKVPKKGINDHGFEDVVEINFNTKVQGKIVAPGYDAGNHRVADVVEKEGGYVKVFNKPPDFDKEEFENMVLEAEKNKKKQEQPTFFESMTLENGVTLRGGPKNQTKTGGPIQIKNRMRIKDFKQASKIRKKQEIAKHAKKKSLGDIDKEFENKQSAEIKKQKYKKTVETWKDEIEKGLVEKGVRFDPELLIKLVMTDDDNHKSKLDMLKIQPGTELFDQWEKLKEEKKFLDQIKKKFDRVMQDPDKYFDRIVAYNTKPLGIRVKPDRKVELFNEFEKIMNGFNEKIMERQDADWGDKNDMNSPNAIQDGAATKPIKPEKFESNVRLRKVVGTQNKLEQVNLLNSKMLKNGSAANLRTSAIGGNRSKMLDTLQTSKSQMLKSGGLLQPIYKGNRVNTIKPESKKLISKKQHEAIKKIENMPSKASSSNTNSLQKSSTANLKSRASLPRIKN